nr:immunoglobulin light chain junction region [Macaca mulatta]
CQQSSYWPHRTF